MHSKRNFIRLCLLLFCLTALLWVQPCASQQLPADSLLLQQSRLYQKGKRNTTTGAVLFGTSVIGALIATSMDDDETPASTGTSGQGWFTNIDIGPSNQEVVYFFSGLIGGLGALKILQGAVRKSKARHELGLSVVPYWKAPGQQAQMPALTLRLQWP